MEITNLVKMYNKFGEMENKFIEETVLNDYEKHINFLLRKYEQCNFYEDLKQELRIGLIKSIRNFNLKERSCTFFTYSNRAMINTLVRKKRYQYLIRIPEYLNIKNYKIYVDSNYIPVKKGEDDYINKYDFIVSDDYNHDIISLYETSKKFINPRQYNILKLHCLGFSNRQIGKTLHLSDASISIELKTIKNKLGGNYNEN